MRSSWNMVSTLALYTSFSTVRPRCSEHPQGTSPDEVQVKLISLSSLLPPHPSHPPLPPLNHLLPSPTAHPYPPLSHLPTPNSVQLHLSPTKASFPHTNVHVSVQETQIIHISIRSVGTTHHLTLNAAIINCFLQH